MKTNFWGASLEIISIGKSHVRLNNFNELFSIQRPTSLCHNLIFGEMYLEHVGPLICEKINGETFILNFKRSGWNRANLYQIEGEIPVSEGSEYKWIISGKWTTSIQAFNEETNETIEIWRKNPLPDNSAQNYNFT